jgi:glycogen phosphorylase
MDPNRETFLKPQNGNHLNSVSVGESAALAAGLNRLARNLWWTWNQDAQGLFEELSPRGWRNLHHNPVAVLHEVSDYELRVRFHDPQFIEKVKRVLLDFDGYMKNDRTWAAENAPEFRGCPVAYFSAEFGFHETLPIAAGGLGILAADHAKSASDLGLDFVGVSLFYRQGYFRQSVDHANWQIESYSSLQPKNLPLEPVLDAKGEPVIGAVALAAVPVKFRAWRVNVGRVPVFLLDTDLPENDPQSRDLTSRLYDGDSTSRILQELLLGVGGVRLLRALSIEPCVFHLNEGHAAFLILEVVREKMAEGLSFELALAEARQSCVFTTHTPVEAGHDRFHPDLVKYATADLQKRLKIPAAEFLALGRVHPDNADESFCMTVLALKGSRSANGVSELHGRVSRAMWKGLWPERSEDEVPIGHVTNGVHLRSWMNRTTDRFWKRLAGDNWPAAADEASFWARAEDPAFVSDEEIWALRYALRRELIEYCRYRLLVQGQRITAGDFITFDALLNPDALTIGFARRFATYKRAPLIFQKLPEIVELAKDAQRPVQFIFAGKAHPRDDEGKRYIQQIAHLSKHSDLKGALVFVEDYDMELARFMTAGCDVWLNNPRRPLEASGTSGQKCGSHGNLNMSIMDGWWREGFDGRNGFAIGGDSHPPSIEEQDRVDADCLHRVLTEDVVPAFYDRDASGLPRRWIKLIRRAMATLVPKYDTRRMVQEYVTKYYQPK